MNRRTANEILKEYALNATDAARLVAEMCEAMGERAAGLERAELMMLLRRVVNEGAEAVKKAEETVPFAVAVRLSLEARSGLRPTSRRNLRHYTNRMLRIAGVAERPEHRAMQLSLKLMLYCGVRPTEVTRLNPQRDIVGDELIIRPATSKTGGGRVVPLRKVAAFIRRHRDGLVIPPRRERRRRALRRAARFGNRRADVCRHTFASYHARRFRDPAALQYEMGHRDGALLRSRYIMALSGNGADYWS